MNKNLIIHPTKDMSRETWLAYRMRGIGASEVGTILGLNQYQAPIELFYKKLAINAELDTENIFKFMGKYHENAIADLWQYWEGTEQSMIDNYAAGRIVRRCRRVNAYISNPKYPWLFVSLDRIINKRNERIPGHPEIESESEGNLEIKTISGYESSKWETTIPPGQLAQVVTQMAICEFEFGELATMTDGRFFTVWPFKWNPSLAESILLRTKEFWDKVLQARKLLTQKYEAITGHNIRLANSLQSQLESLEPPPDGSEAYENFLKDKFKKSLSHVGLIRGSDAEYQQAVKLKLIKAEIKTKEEDARLIENNLKRRIADGNKLDFGRDGYIQWSGEPRRFLNKVK